MSQKACIAIRALCVLAAGTGGMSLKKIARRCRVPHDPVRDVLEDLHRSRLVACFDSGDYALALPAAAISIADAIHAVDGMRPVRPRSTLPSPGRCSRCEAGEICALCAVERIECRLEEAAHAILDNFSLAEAAAKEGSRSVHRI